MTSVTTDRLQGVNSGIAIKVPCRVATTANIALSGLQTIDGVTLVANDRVLVKDQTNGIDNGIWVASTATWNRSLDFDGANDVRTGTLVRVNGGILNGGLVYVLTTADPISIGATTLSFSVSISLTDLGVSAFAQTLLDDTSAAAARTTLGVRDILSADRTYYVRTDGSDANTGLVNNAGGAFQTLQHAADVIWNTLDTNGHTVIVSVGAGTYSGVHVCGPATGDTGPSAGIYFLGDTTTPSNVVVSTTEVDCFFAERGAQLNVGGFKCTTATSGFCVHAQSGGKIVLAAKMDFGSVPSGYAQIYADFDGWLHLGGVDYTISGGGSWHMLAEDAGTILAFTPTTATVTITGSPSFASAFAQAQNTGYIRTAGYTYSGTVTATRYNVNTNGAIFADGTANYFPGTVAGSSTSGGSYYNIPGSLNGTTITASTQVVTPAVNSNAALPVDLKTSGGVQVRVAHTASAVNFPVISGAAAAGRPYIYIDGTDTNPGLDISSKGSGSIILYAAQLSRKMLELIDAGTDNRHIKITAGGAATNPKIEPTGGNIVFGSGSALATNATNGMIMVPSCAGTPTGAPTDAAAGRIPFIYDTTANKLWAYNGSWRSVAVA